MAARPFALVCGALMWVAATVLGHGSARAQTDEIYTRGEDRRDAQDNGDGPFCGPGTVAPFPAGYDSPPDKYPAGDRCAGELSYRGYYMRCGPSCNAKWMYCWRSPEWTGPPPACDTIVTISGDEPAGGGSSPPSSGQDTVSTGGGAGSGGGSGSSGGGDCNPPDHRLSPKARWKVYHQRCLGQLPAQEKDLPVQIPRVLEGRVSETGAVCVGDATAEDEAAPEEAGVDWETWKQKWLQVLRTEVVSPAAKNFSNDKNNEYWVELTYTITANSVKYGLRYKYKPYNEGGYGGTNTSPRGYEYGRNWAQYNADLLNRLRENGLITPFPIGTRKTSLTRRVMLRWNYGCGEQQGGAPVESDRRW